MSSVAEDPCGEFGDTQKWAAVWFVVLTGIGVALTVFLAQRDRWMFDNNGELLDNVAYRENRLTSTSLKGETFDSRKDSTYGAVVEKLSE